MISNRLSVSSNTAAYILPPQPNTNMTTDLTPLPFHREMRDFLRDHHGDIWREYKKAFRDFNADAEIELLKVGYRLEPEDFPLLFALVDDCREKLGIEEPILLYQGDQHAPANACLYFTEPRGHILFQGNFLEVMSRDEVHSTIAHELGHFLLYKEEGGDFLTVDRILRVMAAEEDADPAIEESRRIFQLYEEIYADRAEVVVMESPDHVVSTLVKMQKGLEFVNPQNYIRQAEELFAMADLNSDGNTHPELYIRTRAAVLWARQDPEVHDKVRRMIEGPLSLERLELLGQAKLTQRTREIVARFLEPGWCRTDSTLELAGKYFEDFDCEKIGDPASLDELASELAQAGESTRHYFACVLLDFAAADPELDRAAYAQAFIIAEQLDLGDLLMEMANMETRPTTRIRKDAARIVKAKEKEGSHRGEEASHPDRSPNSDPPQKTETRSKAA